MPAAAFYNGPVPVTEPDSLSAQLHQRLRVAIAEAGGWLPFDRFMALALYAPGLGYYARGHRLFGAGFGDGSDFVTAPEMSPHFGAALAVQIRQALAATDSDALWEFGAGSGALAEQLLDALGPAVGGYHVVEVSGALGARQRQRLARFGDLVQWHAELPDRIEGVVIGNEVLDALPVQLLAWDGLVWYERGVAVDGAGFDWSDRPTALRPPLDPGFPPGAVTEVHAQAEAFVRSLAERLGRGAMFFIDYGFPESEYYHTQRHGGTLMCHRGHRADAAALLDIGLKDITAHVNFSGIALAAQDSGLDVIGYTSQARFLLNCGLLDRLADADLRERNAAHRLIAEHEMGELFKVIAFARGAAFSPLGFAAGDRTHRL